MLQTKQAVVALTAFPFLLSPVSMFMVLDARSSTCSSLQICNCLRNCFCVLRCSLFLLPQCECNKFFLICIHLVLIISIAVPSFLFSFTLISAKNKAKSVRLDYDLTSRWSLFLCVSVFVLCISSHHTADILSLLVLFFYSRGLKICC